MEILTNTFSFENISPEIQACCKQNVLLAERTTFKIGGQADIFFEPSSQEILKQGIDFFAQQGVPITLFSGGSNVLVSDDGVRGVVLCPTALKAIRTEEQDGAVYVYAEAGVLTSDLAEWSAQQGYGGLETFAGLPGTVGGALFMNARCYGKAVADVFFEAKTLIFSQKKCTLVTVPFNAEQWGYKQSPFQAHNDKNPARISDNRFIIAEAVFKLIPTDSAILQQKVQECLNDRKNKRQFDFPSAGSIFKNNTDFGKPSGQLIDESGLCGVEYGGAQIAPWHGNLFINKGGASAKDIRYLIEEVQNIVKQQTGFKLEPEVIFVN